MVQVPPQWTISVQKICIVRLAQINHCHVLMDLLQKEKVVIKMLLNVNPAQEDSFAKTCQGSHAQVALSVSLVPPHQDLWMIFMDIHVLKGIIVLRVD